MAENYAANRAASYKNAGKNTQVRAKNFRLDFSSYYILNGFSLSGVETSSTGSEHRIAQEKQGGSTLKASQH